MSKSNHHSADWPIVDLAGIRFDAVTRPQIVDHTVESLAQDCGGWILPVNLDVLRQYVQNPEVPHLTRRATVFVSDGMPLVWASRLQGTKLPQRVCGSDLIWSLSEAAAEAGRSVYLLGGDEGVGEEAAAVLCDRFANLKIAGTYCPPFGFEKSQKEMARIREALDAASPDIIFVALGFPKQERLVDQLIDRLPQTWWVSVGISFSFVAGRVERAPRWIQKFGLEWVHRMFQEPGRLVKRYLIDDIPFAISLFIRSLFRRPFSIAPIEADEPVTPVRQGDEVGQPSEDEPSKISAHNGK